MNTPSTELPAALTGTPRWRTYGLYALALVFFAIIVWRSRIWDAGDTLDNVRPEVVALVPILSIGIALPLAIRQREVLAAISHRFAAWALGPISFYGNTVGYMTPAASGELLRPALFERVFGIPLAQGAAIVLYERLFSFFLFGVSCVFALAWTDLVPLWVGLAALPLLAATAFAPLVAAAVLPVVSARLRLGSLGWFVPSFVSRRLSDGVQESGTTVRTLATSKVLDGQFAFLTYAAFAIMAFQFWLLIQGVGENLSMQEAWVILAASAMAGMASGLPLGLGATDAVMLSLFRAYDVDVTTAGSIVILTRLLINLPTGLLGFAAYVITLRQQSAAGRNPASPMPPPLTPAAVRSTET